MRQESEVASNCTPDHFFDESVENCLHCNGVCGEKGQNPKECKAKCPDYMLKNQMSTSHLLLSDVYETQTKLDIWLVAALASTTVALMSVAIVLAIIWKIRKSVRAIPPVESEERGLMRSGICQESADSSLDTRTTLVPSWNRQPQLTYLQSNLSNTADRLPNAYYSHNNYIGLCEDQLSSPKPSENICGEILIDDCHPASPISLNSDTASPSQPNKVDFDGGLQFSSGKHSSVVSSVHDMPHMVGWLNKTDWVMEYRDGASGLHIGVEGIGKEKAEEIIQKKGQKLPDFKFVVTSPSKGQFIPCPHTGSNRMPAAVVQSYFAPLILKPGIRIYSKEMEPDLDTDACQPGHAIYSGSLVIEGGSVVGLTVGHLFAQECLELSLDNVTPIGTCVKKCESVVHHTLDKITADLALLQISLPTENMICFDHQNYRLRLFKSELSVKPPSHIPIIVLRSDGSFSRGQISNSMFTYKKCGLFNTLCVVDSDDNPHRISNEGDSGSLILSLPLPSSEYLFVYGMVIGYWINDDKTRSHTVATRLWNVLETLSSGDGSLDFSNETHDSGFNAYS